MKQDRKSAQRETHLVINDLQRAYGVGLAILLVAAQGRLAGDLGADGPVVVVRVQRADGLAGLPGAPVPAPQHLLEGSSEPISSLSSVPRTLKEQELGNFCTYACMLMNDLVGSNGAIEQDS